MIRALIDTNVNLDFFLCREGHEESATEIFRRIEAGKIRGAVSSSIVTDIHYIIENKSSAEIALEVVKLVCSLLEILPVNRKTIETAVDATTEDFEDTVQAIAAKQMNINIVVTRDQTGYTDSGMTVFTPQEFLEYLDNQYPV